MNYWALAFIVSMITWMISFFACEFKLMERGTRCRVLILGPLFIATVVMLICAVRYGWVVRGDSDRAEYERTFLGPYLP